MCNFETNVQDLEGTLKTTASEVGRKRGARLTTKGIFMLTAFTCHIDVLDNVQNIVLVDFSFLLSI